jgi:hypothetical protein
MRERRSNWSISCTIPLDVARISKRKVVKRLS